MKNIEKETIFATKYDPRMPKMQPILAKHYRSMVSQDSYLKKCFPKPPLTAFRRQTNIRNFLIRSKVPPPPERYPKRNLKGMKNCGKSCPTCPYIKEGKSVKIVDNLTWKIEKKNTCESFNVVYLLECDKCGKRYIGSTIRQLKHRLADHRSYIYNQVTSRTTGEHWNLPGHSLAHLNVIVLEQSRSNEEDYIREREKYFIRIFDTYNNGLNKEW